MSQDTPSSATPFDLERLQLLIKLMEDHDLSEVDLHNGDQRCRLKRGQPAGMQMVPMQQAVPAVAAAPAATAAAAPQESEGVPIKSPTVGTFYAAASPDDEPFVKVGSKVGPETVVCLVEAMKVYNQITADVSGTVLEVLVSSGDAVDFGQVLFRVRPG